MIKVKNKNGEWVDVPFAEGKPGRDGYTPIKGVDYFDGAPGAKGDPGSDASVTAANIENALGFKPASEAVTTGIKEDIAVLKALGLQVADGKICQKYKEA